MWFRKQKQKNKHTIRITSKEQVTAQEHEACIARGINQYTYMYLKELERNRKHNITLLSLFIKKLKTTICLIKAYFTPLTPYEKGLCGCDGIEITEKAEKAWKNQKLKLLKADFILKKYIGDNYESYINPSVSSEGMSLDLKIFLRDLDEKVVRVSEEEMTSTLRQVEVLERLIKE